MYVRQQCEVVGHTPSHSLYHCAGLLWDGLFKSQNDPEYISANVKQPLLPWKECVIFFFFCSFPRLSQKCREHQLARTCSFHLLLLSCSTPLLSSHLVLSRHLPDIWATSYDDVLCNSTHFIRDSSIWEKMGLIPRSFYCKSPNIPPLSSFRAHVIEVCWQGSKFFVFCIPCASHPSPLC